MDFECSMKNTIERSCDIIPFESSHIVLPCYLLNGQVNARLVPLLPGEVLYTSFDILLTEPFFVERNCSPMRKALHNVKARGQLILCACGRSAFAF